MTIGQSLLNNQSIIQTLDFINTQLNIKIM